MKTLKILLVFLASCSRTDGLAFFHEIMRTTRKGPPMIYTALTNRAMQIAYEAHAGQVDKCGTPYVFHPCHLAEQMPDEVTTCVALLHDVVEDTPITFEELEREFPPEVTEPLRLLTHDPAVPYRDYIDALVVDPVARTVKRADLMHNLDETRFEGCGYIDEAKLSRRRERYRVALDILDEGEQFSLVLEPYPTAGVPACSPSTAMRPAHRGPLQRHVDEPVPQHYTCT